jgi:hypothetical protein
MDDHLARSHAEAMGLTYTGTLGILLRAKTHGEISQIQPLIVQLKQLGFRLSTKTQAAVLKLAGE